MAGEVQKLTVSLSPAAVLALREIWRWNAQQHGADYAGKYIAFLKSEASKLATAFSRGKPVPGLPNLSYVVLRKRQSGHGHLAVFEISGDIVQILIFYHTAQDWQNKLAQDLA